MVDGPAGPQNYVNMDLKAVSDQVDFVTVDGYNYAGSWDTVTNHASPLFDSKANPEFGEGLSIESTVSAYLRAGVPAKKFVLGVPLYGAGWKGVSKTANGLYQPSAGPADSPDGDTLGTNGVATYRTLSRVTGYKKSFDFSRIAVSLYNPANQTFWTFDDPDIAVLKMAYLNMRAPGGLGGAFVWAVKDDDANGTMVKTMASWLGR
jgi:chitinase